jgi:hypothetical protein
LQHPRNDAPSARVITLRDLDAEPPPALWKEVLARRVSPDLSSALTKSGYGALVLFPRMGI